MKSKKSDLIIVAGIGIGSFILGFITSTILNNCGNSSYAEEKTDSLCCGNCDACEFADGCDIRYNSED